MIQACGFFFILEVSMTQRSTSVERTATVHLANGKIVSKMPNRLRMNWLTTNIICEGEKMSIEFKVNTALFC